MLNVMKNELIYALILRIRPLLQQIEGAVEAGLRGTGLTVRMRAFLEVLATEGSLTVPALARRLEINRQYVQLMVNETVAAGFTERRANPGHRRSSLIALTEPGAALINRVRAAEMALVGSLAETLSDADVDAARRVSDHLLAGFRRLSQRSSE